MALLHQCNNIKDHFNDKDVGAMDEICSDLQNVPLRVFAVK